MIRTRTAAIAAAALVLAACGKKDSQPPAGAAPPPAPAEMPAPPTGISGAPGVARRGVDSANAAYQAQQNAVDSIARQAGGGTP